MKRFELFLMVLHVPIDFLAVLLAALSAYFLRFSQVALSLRPVVFRLTLGEYISVCIFPAFFALVFFALAGLYTPNQNRKLASDIPRIFFACAATLAVVALYIMFTQQLFDSRFLVAVSFVLSFFFVTTGRIILWLIRRTCFKMGIGQKRVVVIGQESITKELLKTFEEKPELGAFVVQNFETFSAHTEKTILKFLPLDEIIFTNPRGNEKEALAALAFANEHHIVFKYSADLFATLSANMAMYPVGSIPIVELKRTRLDGWGAVVKRVFDIVGSLCLIVVFFPIMVFVALAIKLDSKGPVFFVYQRVGRFGEIFTYFKFRSMVDGAHKLRYDEEFRKSVKDLRGWNSENPTIKYENDPRITRVGKFLRKYSLDELPEFFLVFLGDMSLVGPRPHEKEEVEKYKRDHKKVLALKPGITGLSQISGRSDLSFDDEVTLDAFYIEKWSVLLDIIILVKTPLVLLKKRKAL